MCTTFAPTPKLASVSSRMCARLDSSTTWLGGTSNSERSGRRYAPLNVRSDFGGTIGGGSISASISGSIWRPDVGFDLRLDDRLGDALLHRQGEGLAQPRQPGQLRRPQAAEEHDDAADELFHAGVGQPQRQRERREAEQNPGAGRAEQRAQRPPNVRANSPPCAGPRAPSIASMIRKYASAVLPRPAIMRGTLTSKNTIAPKSATSIGKSGAADPKRRRSRRRSKRRSPRRDVETRARFRKGRRVRSR